MEIKFEGVDDLRATCVGILKYGTFVSVNNR